MAIQKTRILIADDQKDVLEALRLLLKGEGYDVQSAPSPAGVITAIEGRDFDVVLIDLNYSSRYDVRPRRARPAESDKGYR
jgi:CheY-like chemotaxis protein